MSQVLINGSKSSQRKAEFPHPYLERRLEGQEGKECGDMLRLCVYEIFSFLHQPGSSICVSTPFAILFAAALFPPGCCDTYSLGA